MSVMTIELEYFICLSGSVVSGNHVQVMECTLISFDSSDYKPITSFRSHSVGYMGPVSSLRLMKNMM
jgi:hypothetical protein